MPRPHQKRPSILVYLGIDHLTERLAAAHAKRRGGAKAPKSPLGMAWPGVVLKHFPFDAGLAIVCGGHDRPLGSLSVLSRRTYLIARRSRLQY